MPNQKRMERFRRLRPIKAVQAWLDGAFGINEEWALCISIRREPGVTLSDEEITNVMVKAWDEELDAAACLERMVARSQEAAPIIWTDSRFVGEIL